MPAGNSTIELCRAQLWQWVHLETGVLDTGRIITLELFDTWLGEELAIAEATAETFEPGQLRRAAELLAGTTHSVTLAQSLVDEAYRLAE